VRILGGAYLTPSLLSSITIGTLLVGTNSTFQITYPENFNLTITSNAVIDGLFSADGASQSIQGVGVGSSLGSGGGGHGAGRCAG